MKNSITVKESTPLLDVLAQLAPESSRTTLRSWIKDGRVTVDGNPVKIATTLVHPGETVHFGERVKYIEGKLRCYYADRHIIVVEKPEGMLSVATAFKKEDTVHAILQSAYRTVFPVHRLDQDTSGVMMFALTAEARDGLDEAFEQHAIERSYIAVVEGQVTPPSGTWKSYLYEDANYVVHVTNDPKVGRLAITHYSVLSHSKRYTTLALSLETGRKNQIRVHCSEAGYPILGDKKYGSEKNPIKRVCLHAHVLGFKHPVTMEDLRFTSPIPPEFSKVS